MSNNLLKQSFLLFLLVIYINKSFGYTHTVLMLENNCSTDAVFTVIDAANHSSFQKTIKPHEYIKTKELSNDKRLLS